DTVLFLLRLLAVDNGRDDGGDVLTGPIRPGGVVEPTAPLTQLVTVVDKLVGVGRAEAVPLTHDNPPHLTCLRQLHQAQEVGAPVGCVASPALILEPVLLGDRDAVALLASVDPFALAQRVLLVARAADVSSPGACQVQIVAIGSHFAPPFFSPLPFACRFCGGGNSSRLHPKALASRCALLSSGSRVPCS